MPKSPTRAGLTMGDIARGVGTDAMLSQPGPVGGGRSVIVMCSVPQSYPAHRDLILRGTHVRGYGGVTAADARVEERCPWPS
jgi:hypothetical protein